MEVPAEKAQTESMIKAGFYTKRNGECLGI